MLRRRGVVKQIIGKQSQVNHSVSVLVTGRDIAAARTSSRIHRTRARRRRQAVIWRRAAVGREPTSTHWAPT
jgi:hypothetical protein